MHLNGRLGINIKSPEQKKKTRKENESDRKKPRQKKRNSESASGSNDNEEDAKKKQPRPLSIELLISTINHTRVLSGVANSEITYARNQERAYQYAI